VPPAPPPQPPVTPPPKSCIDIPGLECVDAAVVYGVGAGLGGFVLLAAGIWLCYTFRSAIFRDSGDDDDEDSDEESEDGDDGDGQLPPEWEAHQDDEGTPFYYNTVTRTTSWTRPAAAKGTRTDQVAVHVGESSAPNAPLPQEWEELQDDNGDTYFYNTRLRKASWTRPPTPPASAAGYQIGVHEQKSASKQKRKADASTRKTGKTEASSKKGKKGKKGKKDKKGGGLLACLCCPFICVVGWTGATLRRLLCCITLGKFGSCGFKGSSSKKKSKASKGGKRMSGHV